MDLNWILQVNQQQLLNYEREIGRTDPFLTTLRARIQAWKASGGKLKLWMNMNTSKYLYVFCRLLRPKIVIETGVGPGATSAFMLLALGRNQQGHLFSIDHPGHYTFQLRKDLKDVLPDPKGYGPGWLVSEDLRERWSIILGDSKVELPKLLGRTGTCDVFLHDSFHTYEHMMFEYQTVWPWLASEGLLLSDDVEATLANHVFEKFCTNKGLKYAIIHHRLGVARKLQDEKK